MARFEEDEAAEAARRKAKLDNPVDDDGFVTVTHKRKRGRNSGIPSHSDGTADAPIKKRKGSDKLTDFYRFQVRVCAFVVTKPRMSGALGGGRARAAGT